MSNPRIITGRVSQLASETVPTTSGSDDIKLANLEEKAISESTHARMRIDQLCKTLQQQCEQMKKERNDFKKKAESLQVFKERLIAQRVANKNLKTAIGIFGVATLLGSCLISSGFMLPGWVAVALGILVGAFFVTANNSPEKLATQDE